MLRAVPSASLKSGRETSSQSPPSRLSRYPPAVSRRQLRSSSSPRARRRQQQQRFAQVPQRRGHSTASSSLTASFSGSSCVVLNPACFGWTSLLVGPPLAVDAQVLWIATTGCGWDATLVFLHRGRAACERALASLVAGLRALAALLKSVLRALARFGYGYGAKVRDACAARLGDCLLHLRKAR
ncbi:hypothetical protein HPB50_001156 [Hyalomma asiaticum]|uniref:Uncharacterized protein n=1 Tax=Hyalomma asiaticum TaxID=266040 RepID=A0ACB7TAG6_HYAAI|nr:hypothetical protein HPB50_001156 [Hyalomma asiaticum]